MDIKFKDREDTKIYDLNYNLQEKLYLSWLDVRKACGKKNKRTIEEFLIFHGEGYIKDLRNECIDMLRKWFNEN